MSSSRKQLIAQITILNNGLYAQEKTVIRNRNALRQHYWSYSVMFAVAILIPVVWLGWKAKGERWIEQWARQCTELLTVAFLSYFKRQIVNFLYKSKN